VPHGLRAAAVLPISLPKEKMMLPVARIASRAMAAAAGRSVVQRLGVPDGRWAAAGQIAAFAVPLLVRRVSPWGMIGMAVGAWALDRLATRRPVAPPTPTPIVTPPPMAWGAAGHAL
jgi:hypothetical protein